MARAKKNQKPQLPPPVEVSDVRTTNAVETSATRTCYQLANYKGVFISTTMATGIAKTAPQLK